MVREFLFYTPVRSVASRFENVAMIHLATVDVQRDGWVRGPAVRQGVIFERRDEAPRRSLVRFHAWLRLETEEAVLLFEQVVLADFHIAVDNAFDTPDPGMVVEWSALAL